MIEKTGNVKGAGLHWDIVLLCIINAISAIFGGEFFMTFLWIKIAKSS